MSRLNIKCNTKKPICLKYFLTFFMLQRLNTFISPAKLRSCIKPCSVNRPDFITVNYRNNTNIACFLVSVNKTFLFLSLFSVLFSLKDVSKNSWQFFLILFFSTISLIPFIFFSVLVVALK